MCSWKRKARERAEEDDFDEYRDVVVGATLVASPSWLIVTLLGRKCVTVENAELCVEMFT